MRDAFTRVLQRLAAEDPNLLLVTGGSGIRGIEAPSGRRTRTQFINAGIAEQAMTGLAAGLAREGKTVLTYSIGNFPTLRCLEQIRNDCAYHKCQREDRLRGRRLRLRLPGHEPPCHRGHGCSPRPAPGNRFRPG